MRLGIVDADTILYIIALRFQDNIFDEDPDFPTVFTEDEYERMFVQVEEFMSEMMFEASLNKLRCYLTGSENFRYNFLPSYKWRRDSSKTPKALKQLKQMCLERLDYFFMIEGEEADDSCTRDFTTREIIPYIQEITDRVTASEIQYYQDPKYYEKVICHIDKDLDQVAGEHYGYTNNGEARGLYTMSQKDADAFLWIQVLAGDTADCYKGCPQVGNTKPAKGGLSKAERIIHENLCVKPLIHTFTKGTKKGQSEIRWEEYIDRNTTIKDRVKMWYLKGYATKGGQGHELGFDTTSGYEDNVKISLPIYSGVIHYDEEEWLLNEINIQYNIAYMLRAGEDIPIEMRKVF